MTAPAQRAAVAWIQAAEGGPVSLWWLLLWPLAAALCVAGMLLYRRYWDPQAMERRARRAREQGQSELAIAGYERLWRRQAAFEGKRQAPQRAAEYLQVFRRARVALGELHLERGQTAQALQHFLGARKLGAKLPPAAISLLAEHYAGRGERGPDAVEVYLKYIAGRPAAGPHDRVYQILQSACLIQETSEAAARRTAMALNQRVIKARAELEWAHYYLGLGHLLAGEIPAAAEALEQARRLNPGRALTYYWLGACRLQQTPADVDGAIQVLAKFLSAATTNEKFIRRQERAALELGRRLAARAGGFEARGQPLGEAQQADLVRAREYFQYAVVKNPASQEGHFSLGRAWSLAGERDKAIVALETAARLAAEREPRQPALALKRCLYYLAAEHWRGAALDKAASALARATQLDPDFAEAHALAADVHLRLGDYTRAESHARASMRLRGPAPGTLACLLQALFHQERYQEVVAEQEQASGTGFPGAERAAVSFAVGRSYLRVGGFEKAVEWLGGLAGDPRADYHLGCALAHCGRYDEALECWVRVAEGGGEHAVPAQLQSGHVWLRRGELEAAEAAYLAVEAARPGSAGALYGLAVLCAGRGALEEAAAYLARLLEAEPGSARGRLALGQIEERRGRPEEAVRHYSAALEAGASGPLEATARVRLGVWHCRRGDYRRAVAELEAASHIGEESETLLFYLSLARLKAERAIEAVEPWSRLVARHPEDEQLAANLAQARYLAGAQHAARGDYEQGIAEWERYLECCPEDAQTARELGRMYFRLALGELGRGAGADLARAQGLLGKALERDRGAREAHYYYALCDLGLGRYADCRARLEELAATGDEPRAAYHLGLCLLRQGGTARARTVLERLAQRPGAGLYGQRAACLLGDQLAGEGHYELAAEMLAAGLGMQPAECLT